MNKFSVGQLKTMSEFFNTIAAAWFTGGIIAPFFAKVSILEKILFFIVAAGFSYVFLNISLFFVKGVET